MRIELTSEARNDLVAGAVFYGKQTRGLEYYFIKCLQEDLQTLEWTFGIHERHFHFYRKLSKRFPFAIYYRITEASVEIIAILDCRSDPDASLLRLRKND